MSTVIHISFTIYQLIYVSLYISILSRKSPDSLIRNNAERTNKSMFNCLGVDSYKVETLNPLNGKTFFVGRLVSGL